MTLSIELRFGEEDGGKLHRSIYADLVNLPDPLKLGLTCRIFNYDDVSLYMKVDGYNASWAFTSNNLGILASGANMYVNIDQFGSRAKPAAETTETVTVRLRAYTDAGYTILKWTFERVVDIILIKSDDGSWTQDFLNNFDDGTVQGWAVLAEAGTVSALAVATDYVLSPAYSLKITQNTGAGTGEQRARIYKSFTTPNKNKVFLIAHLRTWQLFPGVKEWTKNYQLQKDSDVLVLIGRPYDTVLANAFPTNKWMRAVAPLPKNTLLEVRIIVSIYISGTTGREYTNFDDIYIISKD